MAWSDEYGAKYEVIRELLFKRFAVLDREAADRRGARSA
jgi:hypothetical protein